MPFEMPQIQVSVDGRYVIYNTTAELFLYGSSQQHFELAYRFNKESGSSYGSYNIREIDVIITLCHDVSLSAAPYTLEANFMIEHGLSNFVAVRIMGYVSTARVDWSSIIPFDDYGGYSV